MFFRCVRNIDSSSCGGEWFLHRRFMDVGGSDSRSIGMGGAEYTKFPNKTAMSQIPYASARAVCFTKRPKKCDVLLLMR